MRLPMRLTLLWLLQAVVLGRELLEHKNDLTVKIGRTVYLGLEDLVFKKAGRTEECRVQIVENDPMSQRVGYLEPNIFDCAFLPNTIKYVHNGSPLSTEDSVKMRVYKFTQTQTMSQTFYLNVRIVNTSQELITTRGLRPVVVAEFNGLSNTIDTTVIRFLQNANQNVSCTIGFSRYKSHWPLVGQMVMGERRQSVEAVKKDCREFLYMKLHYEHLKSPTPDVDYLPLTVELFDPLITEGLITERFFLPIHIKGAMENTPPRSSYKSMYMMDVDQFVLSPLIPDIISAEDYETPNSQLVYKISKNLNTKEGYLVNLDDHSMPITSFLQDDLENYKIGYQPPNTSYSERKIYEIEFTVYDSHFAHSMPIVLHIAIRPSATNAPRVSYNTGLVLLEGQSRPITLDNLQIVDRDNLNRVRIYVKSGLQYGRLEVNGRQVLSFTPNHIQKGQVVYYHDDSDSIKDNIDLRLTDGSNTVLASFPITIIPKDDSPPYMINNLGLELNEGSLEKITSTQLLAHDTDSVDVNIIYNIVQPPESGEIIRKLQPSDTGTRINKFIQRDIIKCQIYYRHFGVESFKDSFIFTLRDHQDPPNESDRETFHIVINPVNENPPRLSPQATRLMHVLETDIAYITRSELQYTDVETGDKQLTYTITSEPYFIYSTGAEDAGKMVATHNLTMVMKDEHIPSVQSFTQEDINYLKIAYLPPIYDIGPESRLVRFIYSVEDSNGNKVVGQHFDIDVQPVNNQPPQFVTSKLLVEEGGILGISTNQLSATDIDTIPNNLYFIVETLPKFGAMQKSGATLIEDDTFTLQDLRRKDIRYVHDGAEVVLDTFTLTLSDRTNRVSKIISVDIVPIDDQVPELSGMLKPHLIVAEGGEEIITSMILSATDEDTSDDMLVFLIVRQPKYGVMRLDERPATKFTQSDVKNRLVNYIHTGGEIGSTIMKDSLTLIVSDLNYLPSIHLPMFDLNITITPVNNQRPTIIMGSPVFVDEGGAFRITPDVLTAKDPDSEPEEIEFVITKQPHFGYIENMKPSPGSEKSNAGVRTTSFKLQDIIDNSINYVQANHKGLEPIYDEFQCYATDGKHQSPAETIGLTIVPQNDEEPDVMLHNFEIEEGQSIVIDQSMVDAIDLDMPKDSLTLSISQPPEHGDIIIMIHTRNGEVEAAVNEFSLDELHSGMELKYRHDNSEYTQDKFALTVSDGKHEVKKVCNITINAVNDESPHLIKNEGLHLEYGDATMISSLVLQAQDEDNSEYEIYYIIVTIPRKGSLQFCTDPFAPTYESRCTDIGVGSNFTQLDVDMNRIRYIHTTSMGGSKMDSFHFVLSDGLNKRPAEKFTIRIRNSVKANLALLNRGLKIREGERTRILTSNLSASDETTNADEIVFAVIKPPKLGQIEYIEEPRVAIQSFTQLDLASSRIVYNHLTKTDITEDSFTFTVTNGMSDAKDGEFKIVIEPLDKILPTLVVNNLIEVLQGSEIAINPLHLKAEDPDTSVMNLTYVIAKPPTYGHLYNRLVLITQSFTQNDLDMGFVTYESDGSHAGLDNFLFTIVDGRHKGFLLSGSLQLQPVMASIFIKPLVNDAPKLLVNKHPDSLEYFNRKRYGFRINSRNLKAVDSETENAQLIYIIESRLKHGHIENIATKRFVRRRFTQEDLDDNSLQYILDNPDTATNDSFTFRIEDSRGNSLEGQRFEMNWSVLELSWTNLVICENVGTLTVQLIRHGAMDQMAFVSIRVREMSAKNGDDFSPSTASQVQFEPGMSRATWDIMIREDHLEENNEKLRLLIEDPINAILGPKDKANIRIINAKNGECPEYLGMISKHNPLIPDSDGFLLPGTVKGETKSVMKLQEFGHLQDSNRFESTFYADPWQEAAGQTITADMNLDPNDENREPARRKVKKKKKQKKKNRNSKKRKTSSGVFSSSSNSQKNSKSSKSSDWTERREVSNNKAPQPSPMATGMKSKLEAPQRCNSFTKNLLHFDVSTQQMYKCNGQEWQVWSPVSNRDQQHDSMLCPHGWSEYQNRCYKFINERLTWESAEQHCRATHNSHLTSVRSHHHNKWLSTLAGKSSFWIGLNDKDESDVWQYVNGNSVTVTKWRKGGPRVKRTLHIKNCVLVNKKQRWKNKVCNKPLAKFICEQSGSTKRKSLRHHVIRKLKANKLFTGF